MNALILTLAALCVCFAQKETKLKVTNTNPFTVEKLFDLTVDEGFYDEVITRSSPNGSLYLYDKGNKVVHRFSKEGKHLSSFGKEGNGPGEFSNFVVDFSASNDRLIFKNMATRAIMFFKSDGTFIKEVKQYFLIGSQIVPNGDRIEFHFPNNELTKTLRVVLSKDGDLIETAENKGYEAGARERQQQGFNEDQLKKNLQRPISFLPYNGGFVQHYMGAYTIDVITKNHKAEKRMTYDYPRVKIDDVLDLAPRMQREMIKRAPERNRQAAMQIFEKVKKEMGGYHGDIVDILGSKGKYLVVQTKLKDNDLLGIHILNDKNEIVQVVTLKCDELTSVKYMNGLLLVNQTNEEDGPYASVYRI